MYRIFSTDEAAILELVKNAYDANALNLKITFQNDTLRFEDNGIGMNADDIKKHWMHIGKSSKEYEIIDENNQKKNSSWFERMLEDLHYRD